MVTLLEGGAQRFVRDQGNSIPLHRAAEGGHTKIVEKLLDHDLTKSAQLSAINAQYRTPKEEAMYAGYWETALHVRDETRSLLGTDRNIITDVLDSAVEANNLIEVTDLLGGGFDVDTMSSQGITPLNKALLMGHGDLAELLIDRGASVHCQTPDGWKPLHCAAFKGLERLVRLCLDKGADLAARSADGQTALHKACKSGSVDTTKLLLAEGADYEARDYQGWRPIHVAAAAGSREIVDLLIDTGAFPGANVKGGDTVQAVSRNIFGFKDSSHLTPHVHKRVANARCSGSVLQGRDITPSWNIYGR